MGTVRERGQEPCVTFSTLPSQKGELGDEDGWEEDWRDGEDPPAPAPRRLLHLCREELWQLDVSSIERLLLCILYCLCPNDIFLESPPIDERSINISD